MKRVITGERDGKSYFAEVGSVDPVSAHGFEVWQLWGHDAVPYQLPLDGSRAYGEGAFPGPAGVRMTLTHVLPTDPDGPTTGAGDAEELNDLIDESGFHQTDSVDIGWVISGEVGLELDSGETVWMTEGDLIVQNGTHHAWRNRTQDPAVMGFVTLGATRAG